MSSVLRADFSEILQETDEAQIAGKTFLITGACGFIASYLVRFLMYFNESHKGKEATVVALCRNKAKAQTTLADVLSSEYLRFLVDDVLDADISGYEINYLIHAAGISTSDGHRKYPIETLSANMVGTYNLLKQCAEMPCFERFVYFSSGAVYGDIGASGEGVITESAFAPIDPLSPDACYATAKRSGEALCGAFAAEQGVPCTIVRISHTYGPGIDLNDGHVYSDFAKSLLNETSLVIRGDGSATRPFCYVSDAVTGVFCAMKVGGSVEAFNMANEDAYYSINGLAQLLSKSYKPGTEIPIVHLVPSVEGDCAARVCAQKLRASGWQPRVDPVEGFRRTVEYCRERGMYER
ncbi:NAD-dependent epimerase/dehydratase family protein [Olsenella sp. An270]|uniref:NAD-dependent epimerase/dehydratase family protein n=1 Tax=Olsenella sp. An270 TaxID=1965615 RepID=UPI000B3782F4|nr:NAD-dependent epimerase/dehydratase family protein [Olsenella sp. An270]OUO58206.1 hypothetical protein B5F73_09050 [Olsenella sp. An270]